MFVYFIYFLVFFLRFSSSFLELFVFLRFSLILIEDKAERLQLLQKPPLKAPAHLSLSGPIRDNPHTSENSRSLWQVLGSVWGVGSDILFPLQPLPLPIPTNPPGRPTREGLISVHFGSVRLRLAPFGSVSGLFRVRFRGVGWVVVGSVRGAYVREKNITRVGFPRKIAGKFRQKCWRIFPEAPKLFFQEPKQELESCPSMNKAPKRLSNRQREKKKIGEKVQGATRLGATGPRASERQICL